MNGRERIRALFNNVPADRCGFWLGNPAPETRKIYFDYFNAGDDEKLLTKIGGDMMWFYAEKEAWKHPECRRMFGISGEKRVNFTCHGTFADNIFAECEDVREVEAFDWPNPDHLDFSSVNDKIDCISSKGMAVLGGLWTPFFHVVADFFGMEEYFVKMYTEPEVVEAVTEKVLDFYLEANKRYLDLMAHKVDVFFFGNDFGTQEDLVCHERHKGDGGRPFDGGYTGRPIKQPYAAVVKSHGSEQLGKRLSKQSCELYEDERK